MINLLYYRLILLVTCWIYWVDSYVNSDLNYNRFVDSIDGNDNKGDDVYDLTVNLKDPWGYEAIKLIHNKMDDDQNGSIERKESLKFIVKDLQINEDDIDGKEKKLQFGDGPFSVDEMWQTWSQSPVSKWTVDETVDWLIYHVKLPQYAVNFIENHIDGSRLPRLAANPAFLIHILKITDPLDRQKIAIKAIEEILFGTASKRLSLDRYLVAMLTVVSLILWFIFHQRQNVQQRLNKVFRQMSTLQELRDKLLSIQKELEKAKEDKQQAVDETENLSVQLKSQSQIDATPQREAMKEREAYLINETAAARRRLAQAEQMLSQTPFERVRQQKVQLQRWLQITYEIENRNYNDQKTQLEAELIKYQNQFRGKSKKSIRRQASSTYHGDLKATRLRLTELINHIEFCRDKWITIETLCGFSIRDNPGLVALQQIKPSFSSQRMQSLIIDESEPSDREDESITPSPVDDFFQKHPLLHRTTSRTSDYVAIKRNNSTKQLTRMISNDESNDNIRWPLRSGKSMYLVNSSGIENDHHDMLPKSGNSNLSGRMLIRRSSSLQDILFRMPNHGQFNDRYATPAEI